MANPRSETTLADTMTRMIHDLSDKHTTRIHIQQEANGDPELARRMLESAAKTVGMDIEIKEFRLALQAKKAKPATE